MVCALVLGIAAGRSECATVPERKKASNVRNGSVEASFTKPRRLPDTDPERAGVSPEARKPVNTMVQPVVEPRYEVRSFESAAEMLEAMGINK